MSKGSTAKTAKKARAADSSAGASPAWAAPRMKPHRKLFIVLLVLFFAWLGVLLILERHNLYPREHPPTTLPF